MFTRAAAIESSSIRSVCTQHAKTHRGATGDMLFRHGTGTGCSTFHGALPVRNSKQSSPSRKALDLVGVIVDSDPADSLKSALSTQRPRDAPGRSFCDEPVCVHRNKRCGPGPARGCGPDVHGYPSLSESPTLVMTHMQRSSAVSPSPVWPMTRRKGHGPVVEPAVTLPSRPRWAPGI